MQSNIIQLRPAAERLSAPGIHDGHQWLQERHDMSQPAAIITRMAEDIAVMRRDFPEDPVELTSKGWTLAQVTRYGDAARGAYELAAQGKAAPARQDNHPAPDLLAPAVA